MSPVAYCIDHYEGLQSSLAAHGLDSGFAHTLPEFYAGLQSGKLDPRAESMQVAMVEILRVAGPDALAIEGCPVCWYGTWHAAHCSAGAECVFDGLEFLDAVALHVEHSHR